MIRLDWDSDFFKLNIFKHEQINRLIENYNFEKDYDLIYLFDSSNFQEENRVKIKKLINIEPIDVKRRYFNSLDFNNEDVIEGVFESFEFSDKLLELVYESGIYSRFKLDVNLNYKFNELYLKWIENYFKGDYNKKVYIYKNKNKEIMGFVAFTLLNDEAKIDLIAVDKNSRGQNIASKLIRCAQNFIMSKNIKKISVATQSNNTAACKLYEKNGFNEYEDIYIYHFWK